MHSGSPYTVPPDDEKITVFVPARRPASRGSGTEDVDVGVECRFVHRHAHVHLVLHGGSELRDALLDHAGRRGRANVALLEARSLGHVLAPAAR